MFPICRVRERDLRMTVIAKWFVLRSATAAQRNASLVQTQLTIRGQYPKIAMHIVRTVCSGANHIFVRSNFRRAAVMAFIMQRSAWASHNRRRYFIRAGILYFHPPSFLGIENRRQPADAFRGMNASRRIEAHGDRRSGVFMIFFSHSLATLK